MNKFWNFSEDAMGRVLHLNGTIASESWVDDDVTPQIFKNELMSGSGPLTLWINSPGGDVFAAAQIYNMLMDYKDDVTVTIDGIAASAASVIAMAGTTVNMSPVAMMMIHNPMTVAIGDSKEMEKAIAMLSEVKESILNAYEIKTSLSRVQLSHLMDAESWFNAKKALELGFADSILYEPAPHEEGTVQSMMFSQAAVTNQLLLKLADKKTQPKTPVSQLEKRLSLLK
ncbi:head maturation protease, ClpP-related [Streptococcus anginosus]|uniref:ATP-dependent Clp protease proteolytic subunit n=1 Tax=Streptococcus anginosus subsp. whileyi CCUG 39159 TaxID=1095729 RepID=I0S9E1_STRAP|nr:head maturation protease, ClpP-related [Streptococcus anginosus]EID19994.1 putative ATP-dependent Clp endopeptidase, proteolytic subunit ClpP [Streptococcus anginosus subsp. whileyi CCUG 39159]QQT08095.1 Clp protease ClpP [Streptococcus anginosus]